MQNKAHLSKEYWQSLDQTIRGWWDGDLHTAREENIRQDPDGTLLYLPWPYSTAGGSEAAFPEMYAWDTYFINLALLEHERYDLVRNHILNYLHMIERYGMMLNGNRTFYRGRSQTPVFLDSIWSYYKKTGDRDLLYHAYPYLVHEFKHYWSAPHHHTSTGLSTNNDIAGTDANPLFAAISEILDFTAIFETDVRQCIPIQTNCALVRYARILADMASELAMTDEAQAWREDAEQRSQRIRDLCWNEEKGFFFEYNFVEQRQLPFWSVCPYWTLWSGVATSEQAKRLVENLARFEHGHGLAFTDIEYPSPWPDFKWLQWGYPAGWPPVHCIVVAGLQAYGYHEEARRVAGKFLGMMMRIYNESGHLYEKYNVVDGSLNMPIERYKTPPMHGWSSAAVVVLGRVVFGV